MFSTVCARLGELIGWNGRNVRLEPGGPGSRVSSGKQAEAVTKERLIRVVCGHAPLQLATWACSPSCPLRPTGPATEGSGALPHNGMLLLGTECFALALLLASLGDRPAMR
jgi:hypothetical protein